MFEAIGLALTQAQRDKFALFLRMLTEANEKLNLTAITEPGEIYAKHFADSCLPVALGLLRGDETVADVGTGAGFPGIPLAILLPELRLTMIDGTQKRLAFVREVCAALGVVADVRHARAEDFARAQGRGAYAVVVSRAVAPLPVLAELTLPLAARGGRCVCYKGSGAQGELVAAGHALEALGARAQLLTAAPPWGQRALVVLTKERDTPAKYPRAMGQIKKAPL